MPPPSIASLVTFLPLQFTAPDLALFTVAVAMDGLLLWWVAALLEVETASLPRGIIVAFLTATALYFLSRIFFFVGADPAVQLAVGGVVTLVILQLVFVTALGRTLLLGLIQWGISIAIGTGIGLLTSLVPLERV